MFGRSARRVESGKCTFSLVIKEFRTVPDPRNEDVIVRIEWSRGSFCGNPLVFLSVMLTTGVHAGVTRPVLLKHGVAEWNEQISVPCTMYKGT